MGSEGKKNNVIKAMGYAKGAKENFIHCSRVMGQKTKKNHLQVLRKERKTVCVCVCWSLDNCANCAKEVCSLALVVMVS